MKIGGIFAEGLMARPNIFRMVVRLTAHEFLSVTHCPPFPHFRRDVIESRIANVVEQCVARNRDFECNGDSSPQTAGIACTYSADDVPSGGIFDTYPNESGMECFQWAAASANECALP